MHTIPPSERPEWEQILKGKYELTAFAPRLLLDRLRKAFEKNEIDLEKGKNDLYAFFEKYKKAYQKDLKEIFKEW